VDPSGEVVPLDSAGYGSVTMAKSVTIRAPRGVVASITNNGGDGVVVNGVGVRVRLIGLSVESNTLSGNGIYLQQGLELSVEGCSTEGFAIGIFNASSGGRLNVEDTIVRAPTDGIKTETGSGLAVSSLNRVRIENHTGNGVYAGGNSRVTARDSVIVGRGRLSTDSYSGFVALGTPAGSAVLTVDGSMVTATGCAICAGPIATGGPTKVVVSNSASFGNDRGAESFAGSNLIYSFGNNRITENNSCNGTCFDGTLPVN
jgi:hypothetical protein